MSNDNGSGKLTFLRPAYGTGKLVLGDSTDLPPPQKITGLVFSRPATGSGKLTFGKWTQGAVTTPDASIEIDTGFEGEGLADVRLLQGAALAVDAGFDGDMAGGAGLLWDANVSRVDRWIDLGQQWQQAAPVSAGAHGRWREADNVRVGTQARWQPAQPVAATLRPSMREADRLRAAAAGRWQEGTPVRHADRQHWQDAERLRATLAQQWQDGLRLRAALRQHWQDNLRLRHAARTHWQGAAPARASVHPAYGDGIAQRVSLLPHWQQAWRPRTGVSRLPPPPPGPSPCYDPARLGLLVFDTPYSGDGKLVFVCHRADPGPDPEPGETVIVPIKGVYLTINSAMLVRLDNGHYIPTTSMALSLDVDSWTWQFSAAVPGRALADVLPNSNGDPVIVQALINNLPFRFTLEKIARERAFASSQLRVSGRGLGAELDSPYAPQMNFSNPLGRTARQLLDDILTLNGVPFGWEVGTWGLTDWYVPPNVFSHAGTYITAINTVAGAAGAYVQPHNTDRRLDVLLRYPLPPWEWNTLAPDFELPADVVTQEGFEWVDKPRYNRVFVSGQEHGVNGRYDRAGTAGDMLAPPIVDPLITHGDAARQRGRAVISDTGRIAMVTLRLPLLAETGVIKPGNFVRYVEGGSTHLGLSRSVSVAVGETTTYQTITLETHLEPV